MTLPLIDPCTPDCPIRRASDVLSGKWTTLIFRELFGGTRRYFELQAALSGISPRILAERLRMLEAEGLVARKVTPSIPPKTEYSLTQAGLRIEGVLRALAEFGATLPQPRSNG